MKMKIVVAAVLGVLPWVSSAQEHLTPLESLQAQGSLLLTKPSADLCAEAPPKVTCKSISFNDSISIKKRADGLYDVELEKRFARVQYYEDAAEMTPFYCGFGGHGSLKKNDLRLLKNDKEDGADIVGLRVRFERDAVVVIDSNSEVNSKYCGGFKADSFDGLIFQSNLIAPNPSIKRDALKRAPYVKR